MVKHAISLVFSLFFFVNAYGQLEKSQVKTKQKTIETAKVPGYGPNKPSFLIEYGRIENNPSALTSTLPKAVGIPTGLKHVQRYFILLNDFQFYFQNYRLGSISKEVFFESAKSSARDLNDTLFLSSTPIKCGVQLITAKDEKGEYVFMVDMNNNGDFSDEPIRILSSQVIGDDNKPIPIEVEYASQNGVASEDILTCFAGSVWDDSENIVLQLIFPEFRYSVLNHKGTRFFLCTNSFASINRLFYVLSPRPYFDYLDSKKGYKLGDYFRIDDNLLRIKDYRENGRYIVLEGQRADEIVVESIAELKTDTAINTIRDQAGFMAPNVEGKSITDGAVVSTANLRGKWVYLDFWSTTCAPCIEEFPKLKKIYQKFSRDQVEFIGIGQEIGTGTFERLMDLHKLPWPTIKTGPSTKMEGYDIHSYPTTVLIDPEGRITYKDIRSKDLEKILIKALNEK